MIRVGILVPIYNVGKYIERCARSLFEQTYSNIEYVFVNDCSTDNSIAILENILREYPNRTPHVKIVHHKSNRGSAASRNSGLDNSKADFLMFVDADDWLEKNATELLLQKQQETDADIVYGNAFMHTPCEISELQECEYRDKHDMMLCYSRFTPGYTMVIWRRLIRKSLFSENNIRWIEGLNYAEDKYILSQLAYYSERFCKLNKPIYHYNRLNENSLVAAIANNQFNLNAFKQEIGNLQATEDFFSQKNNEYFCESAKAKLQYLKRQMNLALAASSKEGFEIAAKYINATDPFFWSTIGWNRGKFHRKLYGNYFYMKYSPLIKRPVKRIYSLIKK